MGQSGKQESPLSFPVEGVVNGWMVEWLERFEVAVVMLRWCRHHTMWSCGPAVRRVANWGLFQLSTKRLSCSFVVLNYHKERGSGGKRLSMHCCTTRSMSSWTGSKMTTVTREDFNFIITFVWFCLHFINCNIHAMTIWSGALLGDISRVWKAFWCDRYTSSLLSIRLIEEADLPESIEVWQRGDVSCPPPEMLDKDAGLHNMQCNSHPTIQCIKDDESLV